MVRGAKFCSSLNGFYQSIYTPAFTRLPPKNERHQQWWIISRTRQEEDLSEFHNFLFLIVTSSEDANSSFKMLYYGTSQQLPLPLHRPVPYSFTHSLSTVILATQPYNILPNMPARTYFHAPTFTILKWHGLNSTCSKVHKYLCQYSSCLHSRVDISLLNFYTCIF